MIQTGIRNIKFQTPLRDNRQDGTPGQGVYSKPPEDIQIHLEIPRPTFTKPQGLTIYSPYNLKYDRISCSYSVKKRMWRYTVYVKHSAMLIIALENNLNRSALQLKTCWRVHLYMPLLRLVINDSGSRE